MDYASEYFKKTAGECISNFLKPYLEKYNISLKIEGLNKSEIILKNEIDNSYRGIINISNSKNEITFHVYLNTEGTTILTGKVINNQFVAGTLARMDDIQKNELIEFTVFNADINGQNFNIRESHYSDNVREIGKKLNQLNWTWGVLLIICLINIQIL